MLIDFKKKNNLFYFACALLIISLAFSLYLYKKNSKKIKNHLSLHSSKIQELQKLNKYTKKISNEFFYKITKSKISQVFALRYHENFIYATCTFHNRVVKLDMNLNNIAFMDDYGIFEKINIDDKQLFEKKNQVVGKIPNVHSIDFDKSNNIYISQYLPSDINNNSSKGITVIPSTCLDKCTEDDLIYIDGWNGVSHIELDHNKEKILVADYGNGEFKEGDIYILDLQNLKVRKKLSKISGYNFTKPHMIRYNNNFYYALDVKNKEIAIFDKNFNLVKVISNNLLKQINKSIKIELFDIVVAITFSKNHIFVSDVGRHAIYIFDYNWNLKSLIEKNIYFSNQDQDGLLPLVMLDDLILNSPFDILFIRDKLYIANTHNDEIIILQANQL